MALPINILIDINNGKGYLANLNEIHISNLRIGCSEEPKNLTCLKRILRSLDYKIELNAEQDSEVDSLIYQMLVIIGGFNTALPPTVSAGADQTASTNATVQFTATATEGTGTIVSYLWTQISGTPATLSNANTATLSVTGFSLGDSTFRVVVTDSNNLSANDSVKLTGEQVLLTAYMFTKDTLDTPTVAEIEAGVPVQFVQNDPILFDYDEPDFKYLFSAIPFSESVKNYWEDAVDITINGSIGTGNDLYNAPENVTDGVTTYKVYYTNYPTTYYKPTFPVRGIRFKTV